jgi:hypothetical protein
MVYEANPAAISHRRQDSDCLYIYASLKHDSVLPRVLTVSRGCQAGKILAVDNSALCSSVLENILLASQLPSRECISERCSSRLPLHLFGEMNASREGHVVRWLWRSCFFTSFCWSRRGFKVYNRRHRPDIIPTHALVAIVIES